MQSARAPETEDKRLEMLRKYNILDTDPEERFDEITKLASQICDVPIALISLVDTDRQWFKSKVGIDAKETPRDVAFCAHAILEPEDIFIVQDATKDERFHDNPLVTGDPNVTFYAGQPLVSEGEAIGTLCVIDKKPGSLSKMQQDALKVLAKQIIAQIELGEALKASIEGEKIKNEFVSIISHELRTPLTSIRGSLGLVMGHEEYKMPEKAKELIGIAHSNCERLVNLVNDILDVDKILAGKMQFNMAPLSLMQITQKIVKENLAYAEKYNVGIHLEPIDHDVKIEVDESRYAQILTNLISNAAKFSPVGEYVEISFQEQDGYVAILVSDNGEGIPKEFHDKIFGKFLQADSSSSRSKDGTGLGLYITKQMTEKMNGYIGFETYEGEGTTFWVQFPICESQEDEFRHINKSEASGDGLAEILHVEDDIDLSRIFALSLEGKVKVVNVRTLGEARKALSQKDFDAIVLDIALPDGSGLDLLDDLKVDDDHAPVMVLSAHDFTDKISDEVSNVVVKSKSSEKEIANVVTYLVRNHDKH